MVCISHGPVALSTQKETQIRLPKSPALANATINQNYTRKQQYSAQEHKGVEERWGGAGLKIG